MQPRSKRAQITLLSCLPVLRVRPFAVIAALLLTACATTPEPPPVIEAFASKNNLKVLESFDAAPSIRGYGIESVTGRKGIVYVVKGKHAFVGKMLDADAGNLTAQHVQDHLYDLQGAYARLQTEARPITKTPDAVTYGFYDPQCRFCSEAVTSLDNAGIDVQWVPVVLFGELSIDALAAIYAAPNELAALRAASEAFAAGQLQDWVRVQTYGTAQKKLASAVTNIHESIMKQMGQTGTPIFLTQRAGRASLATTADLLSFPPDAKGKASLDHSSDSSE